MITDFNEWSSRLSEVAIENLDFRKLISLYDSPQTFFYIDPPYFDVKNYYKYLFSYDDHTDLANLLSGVSGRWLLSYNNNPIIRDIYAEYPLTRLPICYSISRKPKQETELLIANYPLEAK